MQSAEFQNDTLTPGVIWPSKHYMFGGTGAASCGILVQTCWQQVSCSKMALNAYHCQPTEFA